MSTARYAVGVDVLSNKLYAVGGLDNNGNSLSSVERYDDMTDTWTAVASMNTARSGLGVGLLNNKLYAAGSGNSRSSVERLTVDDAETSYFRKVFIDKK